MGRVRQASKCANKTLTGQAPQQLTRDVCLSLVGGGEDSGRLAYVVGALAGPWDLGGVLGGEDVDRRAVHDKVAVAHLDITTQHITVCTAHNTVSRHIYHVA